MLWVTDPVIENIIHGPTSNFPTLTTKWVMVELQHVTTAILSPNPFWLDAINSFE